MILVIGAKSSKLSQPAKEKDLDYSLVYDKDYYITYNPDIAEVYGNEDEKLFEHFLQNGMHEGRRASEYFDVYYYQKHNADLYELYGDELELYYLHYMEYGYSEGRNGSDVFKTDYVGELNTVLKDDQNILCSFSTLDYTAKKKAKNFICLKFLLMPQTFQNILLLKNLLLKMNWNLLFLCIVLQINL